MSGTDNHDVSIDYTDGLDVYLNQRHVAANHNSDDGTCSTETVQTPTLESRTLAPVHRIPMGDSSGLFGADHHQPALTAHSTADAGPGWLGE